MKITYDKRLVSYKSLCDFFWETHDPTNRNSLVSLSIFSWHIFGTCCFISYSWGVVQNFGFSTHLRSAIFSSTEEERKQALESKIRRQMKLNRRILTKITKEISDCEFFVAENQHHKYYLQKHYRLCETLSLRSTQQFVESAIACKLNGYLTKSFFLKF